MANLSEADWVSAAAHMTRNLSEGDVQYNRKTTDKGNVVEFPALKMPRQVQGHWSPYTDNGGTTAAIAGKDFVIIGGDTRLNDEYNFHTRNDESKLFQLTDKSMLASGGMQADRLQLQQVLKFRIEWFKHHNGGRTPSTEALAQLLSTILYQRRWFPYYTFNVIGGLDEKGQGVCYSYDAVGTTEPLEFGTTGTGSAFIEPLLDCILRRQHQFDIPAEEQARGRPAFNKLFKYRTEAEVTVQQALSMLKSAFQCAAERDVYTGDCVKFWVLTKDGIKIEEQELRKD
jgi:20S proteasome subunit beta 6